MAKQHCNASYLTWHVGGNLLRLKFTASTDPSLELCSLVFGRAFALQSLEFVPPAPERGWVGDWGGEHHLAMVGRLTRLTELRLQSWEYREEDVPHIAALTGLINLEVWSEFLFACHILGGSL